MPMFHSEIRRFTMYHHNDDESMMGYTWFRAISNKKCGQFDVFSICNDNNKKPVGSASGSQITNGAAHNVAMYAVAPALSTTRTETGR